MKVPCLDCEQVGCGKHSECEKYLAYDAERQTVRMAKGKEAMIDGYIVEEVKKAKRSSRRYREKKR